jgi:hypothetical protein
MKSDENGQPLNANAVHACQSSVQIYSMKYQELNRCRFDYILIIQKSTQRFI